VLIGREGLPEGLPERRIPGQHDDLGISSAMLAWSARHPHLEH